MMTREEVAEIMTYCQEHTVSHKDRLAELGIAPWRFYDAKSRYAKQQAQAESCGGLFLQLELVFFITRCPTKYMNMRPLYPPSEQVLRRP